ncbi:MAG: hypothetical protein IJ605_04445 [Prevotella sp.]|nr:hypothetical protein [Prevotella sp.]
MRKLLLLLFLTAFIEADAQYFSPRPAIEQWRDSVMQSIRLKPVKSLDFKTLSFPKNEPTHSIMLRNQPVEQSINPASTRVEKFIVYDPEPIFQYNYYYYDNDRTIFGAMLDTVLDIIIDNTSKPKSKPKKKAIDY